MQFLKNIFRNNKKKLIVLGLDGVPYTFIKKMANNSTMPFFNSLLAGGEFRRMNSVIPTISSVAWSSFMTGEDAGSHNIFGFIDREPDPFKLYIPTAERRKSLAIWDELADMGKKSIVLNIPVTYPPSEINGIMVSGFLATDLSRATYPEEIADELTEIGYIIDVDPWLARRSKEKFLNKLNQALSIRFETMFKMLGERDWDYLQCHIMETDRINHFFWQDMEDDHSSWQEKFYRFYKQIDDYIKELLERIDDNTSLIILSDHGFCRIKKEVELNYWLEEKGYLKYKTSEPESVADMAPESKAYSLLPGRIFINRKGREEMGCVGKEEFFRLRERLKNELLELQDEETDDMIISDVYYPEELYNGPYLEHSADLIAVPVNGYDLKGNVAQNQLLKNGFIQGMHTYDDAFIYLKAMEQSRGSLELSAIEKIQDVNKIIIDFFRNN